MTSVPKGLRQRVICAMISSCTCRTKTPEAKYHNEYCRYRILREVEDFLETVENDDNTNKGEIG